MTTAELEIAEQAREAFGPLRLPFEYCPVEPHPKQEWFLRRMEQQVFFGGAAGPGKSWALLMAALQFVDIPEYHALLLRRTLNAFDGPNGLIRVSHQWLGDSNARWNGSRHEWSFPTGSSLRFGYLKTMVDIGQYSGKGYSFVGWDELTQFSEEVYREMFRVLRQSKEETQLANVPTRMRATSNPGGPGHHWVKNWFVDSKTRVPGVKFIPATIHDNPSMDYDAYLETLQYMSPIARQRLIDGDWDVSEEGGKFNREDFIEIDNPTRPVKAVRYWDLAGSAVSAAYPDPDWTVGLRMDQDEQGLFTIRHIVRGRWTDDKVEKVVLATAEADGRGVPVYIEQDPGQAGKAQIRHYQRDVLQGFACHAGLTRQAAKEVRARPVAAAVANKLVSIKRGSYLQDFLDEVSMFPFGAHDDCVDALSGAHNALTNRAKPPARVSSVPRGRISTTVNNPYGRPGGRPF